YNDIKSDVSKNKGDKKVQDKLVDIKNKMNSAFTTYKSDVDKEKMDSEDKTKNKNITKLDKDLNSAFSDIKDGYDAKDKKKIQKGQKSLSTISIKDNQS
ncbi:hypothetical protein BU101_14490, partial [Staphylococcus shinii]